MEKQHKKHIVFLRRLPPGLMWGGLEKLMMDWFDQIDYSACRVTIGITPGGKQLFESRLAEKGYPIEVVEFSSEPCKGAWQFFKQIYKILRPLKPWSVIFVQGDFTDFQFPEVFAGFLHAPKRIYIHENLGVFPPLPKASKRYFGFIPGVGLWWYMQRLSHKARAFCSRNSLVVSQEIKNQLTSLWGYSPNKVTLAYHGVDLQRYNVLPHQRKVGRQRLNLPENDFVFILTARLSKVKRIERAIEAFDRLIKEHKNIWLLIVGDGDLRQELKELANQKTSKERILFLGHQEDIPSYLNIADCYVNSSDMEGICIAMLEALACGLIGVATKCPGPTEVLQNSQTGFLTEKSSEGVYGGMKKALDLSVEERKMMVERGVKFIQNGFELRYLVKNALDLMEVPNLPFHK